MTRQSNVNVLVSWPSGMAIFNEAIFEWHHYFTYLHLSIMSSDIRMSSTKWLLLLLSLMIQSSVGVALSLASVWVDRNKLIIITHNITDMFYYFSLAGLTINIVMFVLCLMSLSVHLTSLMLRRHRRERRRLLYQTEQRAYGAFGYHSIVWYLNNICFNLFFFKIVKVKLYQLNFTCQQLWKLNH